MKNVKLKPNEAKKQAYTAWLLSQNLTIHFFESYFFIYRINKR